MSTVLQRPLSRATRARKAILLVDDDSLIRWALRQALKEDYRVWTASNAEDALKIVNRATRLDGLLVDVRLPGMDGLEFARRARQIRPGIKVFLMTGYDQDTGPRRAFDIRADGYLPKPFDLQVVRDMLVSHLANISA